MSIEENALEAVVAGEVEVPGDIYVGVNVVRQHIAEFFYRAQNQRLLASGETVLAIFDCIILERDGSRLGGLTLHDYAVLTDQHLITWGRGLNKDIIDRFPWDDIELDRFGRRNPVEGVVKFTYLMKPIGNKRKIALRGRNNEPVGKIEPASDAPRGTALYLDLMPAGEVKVCVEMMHYFTSPNGIPASAAAFKERFRADVSRSRERLSTVSFLFRPFYIDMGNGMLVEAGSIAEQRWMASPGLTERRASGVASPYRNQAVSASPARSAPARVTPARAARPQPKAVQPAVDPGVQLNAPETNDSPDRGPADYSMTGNVSVIGTSGALNSGNRQTDTIRGVSSNNNTMRGNREASNKENTLRETASLNTSPLNLPSKLDSYEGRVSGRSASAGQSRLTTATPVTRSAPVSRPTAGPRLVREASPPMPPARAAAPPPPARSSDPVQRQMREGGGAYGEMPPATYVSPPTLPIPKMQANIEENVFQEQADAQARALGRPLVVPIALAIPRGLLNIYSVSRLARGLWIDPRNLGRNISDLSQTVGAIGEVVDVVTNDEGARDVALRRFKVAANTTLGDNIIFHYTVWPFIKPIIDALNLPSRGGAISPATRRVEVRKLDDDMMELEDDTLSKEVVGDKTLTDMGPVVAQDRPPVPPPPPTTVIPPTAPTNRVGINQNKRIEVKETTPPVEKVEVESDQRLNSSGKSSSDPTAGMGKPGDEPPPPKSKLGDI